MTSRAWANAAAAAYLVLLAGAYAQAEIAGDGSGLEYLFAFALTLPWLLLVVVLPGVGVLFFVVGPVLNAVLIRWLVLRLLEYRAKPLERGSARE